MSLNVGTIATYFRSKEERSSFAQCFTELRLKGLVRNTLPGVYVIAEGLWRTGQVDDDDQSFFAVPDLSDIRFPRHQLSLLREHGHCHGDPSVAVLLAECWPSG